MKHINRSRKAALLLVLGTVLSATAAARAAEGNAEIVLETGSYWRCFTVLRDPVTGDAKAGFKPAPRDKFSRIANSPLPAENWRDVDFDDGGWMRTRGPFYFARTASQPGGLGFNIPRQVAMLFLRGRFQVKDPGSAGDLKLSAAYRGGIVVYLNGQEVARANLPEGEITGQTLAEDYPPEAYVSPQGRLIRGGFREPEKYADRLKLRVRSVKDVVIPAKFLRKGENVLAIEIRGTAFRRDVPRISRKNSKWVSFNTCGLNEISLSGTRPGLGAAAVDKAGGPELWNASVLQSINQSDTVAPVCEIRPIRLVGAAGGTYSGQVVLSAGKPLSDVSASVADLKPEKSGKVVPATALEIRYARADWQISRRGPMVFDSLHHEPPQSPDNKVQPIWLTVHVPADAAPGIYRGEMQVKAAGTEGWKVPVRLRVVDWKLPESHSFTTFVDFIESPESVAMQYGVPLWSGEHFEKLKTVFKQLGRVGNKTLYLPLIRRHNLGNAQTMVRWIPKKSGTGEAAYEHDFQPLEKYLDTCIDAAGKPELVVLIVWDGFVSGKSWGGKVTDIPVPVSLFDPETGKVTEGAGPKYSDLAAAKDFWKPVVEGVRKRLAARGLEDALCLGISYDVHTSQETMRVWNELLPGVKWFHQGHAKSIKGMRYSSTVWNVIGPPDPDQKRYHGWQWSPDFVCVMNDRDIWKFSYEYQLARSRNIGEWNLCGAQAGFGRMCADFWKVLRSKKRGYNVPDGNLSARYPDSSWGQLNLRQIPYLAAGKNGAAATARFETMIEGLQECEARILIDKALVDKTLRTRLGDDLAERAQALLDERVRWLRMITLTRDSGNEFYGVALSSWQKLSAELYDTAAEVAAKLKSR